MEIKNARITGTMLGYEDHGIFTCMIDLDYGGGCQGFGGYTLGGDYTNKFIEGIFKALKVRKWEELKGQLIRVKADNSKVYEIGHLLEDSWFNPRELITEALE